jgi:hypothetical protein
LITAPPHHPDGGSREPAHTVLLGRSSYKFFGGYWPLIQHQPAVSADDPRSQMLSEDNRAISRRYDDVDILVARPCSPSPRTSRCATFTGSTAQTTSGSSTPRVLDPLKSSGGRCG